MRRFRFLLVLSTLFLFACGGGGGGGGGPSPPPVTNPPPIPANVIVSPGGDGAIEVDWWGSTSASRYYIYWSRNPGVTPQNGTRQVASSPPAIVSGLSNGVDYYVVVTAENAAGESGASNEAQGVAGVALPARVTGVSAIPGDGEALVSWDTQADADSYRISPFGAVVTDSPYLLTGLTNGQVTRVTVTAINSAGEGTPSQFAEVQPLAVPPGWTRQELLDDPDEGDARAIAADINDSGVAAVAWWRSPGDGREPRLVVSHNVGGTWTTPVGFGVRPQSVALAVAPNGEIHIAYDVGRQNIFWRRFRNGAWSDPVDIDSGALTDSQQFPDLAVDGNGNVFAVWGETTEGVVTTTDVWARRFDAALDEWGGALVIGDPPRGVGFDIEVEAAADDRAFVTWLQQALPADPNGQSNRQELHASIYDGTSWLPAERIGRDNVVTDADTTGLHLEVTASGEAIVVWAQDNENAGVSERWEIGATRYDALNSQWLPPETIVATDGAFRTFSPDAAFDGSGELIAGWRNQFGGDFASISDFDTATMLWGPVTPFPGGGAADNREMDLSRDAGGTTVATWIEEGRDREGVFVRRRDAGSAVWGTDAHVGSASDLSDLIVKTTPSGYTLVVTPWTVVQNDDIQTVLYATIYTP